MTGTFIRTYWAARYQDGKRVAFHNRDYAREYARLIGGKAVKVTVRRKKRADYAKCDLRVDELTKRWDRARVRVEELEDRVERYRARVNTEVLKADFAAKVARDAMRTGLAECDRLRSIAAWRSTNEARIRENVGAAILLLTQKRPTSVSEALEWLVAV